MQTKTKGFSRTLKTAVLLSILGITQNSFATCLPNASQVLCDILRPPADPVYVLPEVHNYPRATPEVEFPMNDTPYSVKWRRDWCESGSKEYC